LFFENLGKHSNLSIKAMRASKGLEFILLVSQSTHRVHTCMVWNRSVIFLRSALTVV